jgi:predicted deacylase
MGCVPVSETVRFVIRNAGGELTMTLNSKIITGTQSGPHLLITAGVHGDEYEPMAVVRLLMRLIDPHQLRGKVTLVPCVNEAAFRRAARVADDGLDLARVCPGDPGGSITHQTAHWLSELIRSADFYIDMHTGGSGLRLYPLAGYMLHTNQRVLAAQRQMARAFDLPIIWGTHPGANGRSLSVARDANIPAIYTETGGGGWCEDAHVDMCVRGCLNVMTELKMLPGGCAASAIQHIVEDPRDNSGYLQIQHPAPVEGFFEPAVSLGQKVSRGDSIGAITDVLGDHREAVTATEDGIVLMLRWTRRVNAGDALAAILPTAFSVRGQGS